MESDPIFARESEENLNSKRASTFNKVQRLLELDFVPFEVAMSEPDKPMAWVGAVGMYDCSVIARKMLLVDFLVSNILGAGIGCLWLMQGPLSPDVPWSHCGLFQGSLPTVPRRKLCL